MAKGNPLMSQMRGKVGDLVFTRLAGEQVTRSRNRNPKNPRTIKQMAQRAALATCVEFFTRGRKNLFKFAFENKRPGESDYNAFVRANIGTVPVQSRKSLVENNSVFGPFIMSQGSLPEPEFAFDQEVHAGGLIVSSAEVAGANMSVGHLSALLIEQYGLQDGDIITIVAVGAETDFLASDLKTAISNGALQGEKATQTWIIKQFTLDSSSNALISTLGIFKVSAITVEGTVLYFDDEVFVNIDGTGSFSSAIAVIASRTTPSGVKVSTSTMKLSQATATASAIGQSAEWKKFVAKNWNTSASLDVEPENILEGSISEN